MDVNSSTTLFFWRQDCDLGNFGDALSLLYLKSIFNEDCRVANCILHLVGSVITQNRINQIIQEEIQIHEPPRKGIFWGCGKKNALPFEPDQLKRCEFLGIRGTLSRDALDLSRDTPVGDTALVLPRFFTPESDARVAGKVLWVPHFHSKDPSAEELDGCPESVVIRPALPNRAEACEDMIASIASAKFVMANAMHAAIVALAYGTPFAFWSGSHIDHPFKWADFTSGVGFSMPFVADYRAGQACYERVRPDRLYNTWNRDALLAVAPFGLRG